MLLCCVESSTYLLVLPLNAKFAVYTHLPGVLLEGSYVVNSKVKKCFFSPHKGQHFASINVYAGADRLPCQILTLSVPKCGIIAPKLSKFGILLINLVMGATKLRYF